MADLCKTRGIIVLNAIHMKAKQRYNCSQQQVMQETPAKVRWSSLLSLLLQLQAVIQATSVSHLIGPFASIPEGSKRSE